MIRILKAAGLALFLATGSVAAAEISAEQKQQIETIVKDFLLEHPELLREMSEKLQAKEQQEADVARSGSLKENAKLIFKAGNDPVAGNPKGDVTVVEFMDYNCGWCKKSVDEIVKLTEDDKNVRVVMKEFPIFGAGSDYAARAALASVKQGKYWDLHRALFKQETQVTQDVVDEVAASLGIDVAKMKTDMDSKEIKDIILANHELAKSLKIEGTPAFIVDEEVVPGYVPLSTLMQQIVSVRANGGCKLC
jgi:protein-disulfide isomerase